MYGKLGVYTRRQIGIQEGAIVFSAAGLCFILMEYKAQAKTSTAPQKIYTKAQLYEKVWQEDYLGDENAVNVLISRLRTKIEEDPRNPVYVSTVWGIGYKLGKPKE